MQQPLGDMVGDPFKPQSASADQIVGDCYVGDGAFVPLKNMTNF